MKYTDKLDKDTIKTLVNNGIINLKDLEKLNDKTSFPNGKVSILSSLDDFYVSLVSNSSKHTALGYKRDVINFIKFVFKNDGDSLTSLSKKTYKDGDITLNKISEWFEYLISNGYDASSIKRSKYAMKSYVSFLSNEYNMPNIDVSVIDIPEITSEFSVLRDGEVRDMVEYATSLRNKLIILFMYETSMRRQELIECKKTDIDFKNLTVSINKPDGTLDRIGYFTKETGKLVAQYIEEWKDEVEEINNNRRNKGKFNLIEVSEYLFQTNRGYQISYSTIFKTIKDTAFEYFLNKLKDKELAEEKVKTIDTETLRHTKRAYLFSIGKSLDQVQAIMGDTNHWNTKRYLSIAQQLYPECFR